MKARKYISFFLALFGVFSLVAYEIAVSDSIWEMAALIAFIGAGRLYLFYEGTSLNEIDLDKARKAFWLSVLTTLAFCAYVIGLYFTGTVDWRGVLIFLLGTFVLSSVEWVFSIRIGEESHSIVKGWMDKANSLSSEKDAMQIQIDTHHQRITSLESELNAERLRAKTQQEQIDKLRFTSELGANLIHSEIAAERIGGRWVLPCPECREQGKWNILSANSNAGKTLICQDHGLVWEFHQEAISN